MAPQKETVMVLKMDLDCPRCCKKVKKLLSQFPQIKEPIYNEKQNTVTIRVVCCSPEKIRDKLCSKSGRSIKSIEILEPAKPGPTKPPPPVADNPKPAPAPPPPAEKPKELPPPPPETPKEVSPPPEPPKPAPETPKDPEPAPEPPKPDPLPPKSVEPVPVPVPVYQPEPVQYRPVYPVNVCCAECYEGGRTGPCYNGYGNGYGYGVPPPPPPPPRAPSGGWCCYYDDGFQQPPGGYYYEGGSSGGYGYGYNYKPGYCVSRCGDYINDENATSCTIM